jgi:flagellar biogenesis protein FliO
MRYSRSAPEARRGITVLSLLLLIIGLVIVAIFLVRYLRSRPAVSMGPTSVILCDKTRHPERSEGSTLTSNV